MERFFEDRSGCDFDDKPATHGRGIEVVHRIGAPCRRHSDQPPQILAAVFKDIDQRVDRHALNVRNFAGQFAIDHSHCRETGCAEPVRRQIGLDAVDAGIHLLNRCAKVRVFPLLHPAMRQAGFRERIHGHAPQIHDPGRSGQCRVHGGKAVQEGLLCLSPQGSCFHIHRHPPPVTPPRRRRIRRSLFPRARAPVPGRRRERSGPLPKHEPGRERYSSKGADSG